MVVPSYERGLVRTSDSTYTFLQPDGSWGWANAGLIVGDHESILVDTFFDLPNTRELLGAIGGAVDRPITRLVNTHHNGDHCWGNQLVPGATIVGHTQCRDGMLTVQPSFLQAAARSDESTGVAGYLKRAFSPFDFDGIEITPPSVTFDTSLSLHLGPREIRLLYFGPCHTLGDVAVWVPDERVLFCGDLLFFGSTPLVWEGSLHNWVDTVDALLELSPDVVVPGHGPLTNADGLRDMQEYLRLVITEGRRLKEAELSPLDAAREIDLGAYAEWKDSERLALNLMRLWLELDGKPPEEPVNIADAFAAMAALSPELSGEV
jgi:glyoxylase-like metal-dependent hydrolase (beta-lactamase superfamily II)